MRITPPNYTQTPNDLFDHWLPLLKETPLKVLLFIMRKTFGWHKGKERISISQLSKATGKTEWQVKKAVKFLVSEGLLCKEVHGDPGKQQTFYSLVVEEYSNNSYPAPTEPPPGSHRAPPLSSENRRAPLKETLKKKSSSKPSSPKKQSVTKRHRPEVATAPDDDFKNYDSEKIYDRLRAKGIKKKIAYHIAIVYSEKEIDKVFKKHTKYKGEITDISAWLLAACKKNREAERGNAEDKRESYRNNHEI